MSTNPTTPVNPIATASPDEVEIRIYSHSNLFYWWPVWAVGFLMALLTFVDDHRMALVPKDTKYGQIEMPGESEKRDVLIAPAGKSMLADPEDRGTKRENPWVHMSATKSYGVLYAVVLLLVIVITNVPLRGMWSVLVIIVIILLAIIFALAKWWDPILRALDQLHIYINSGGYTTISVALFVIWLVTTFYFDRQVYMIFTPGQLRVCQEIGGGEKVYDTMGMTLEKQRSDLFRHWILGLGSGDLIVNTSGAQAHHFELHNVLFVGRKVKQIEDMLREKAVVRGR